METLEKKAKVPRCSVPAIYCHLSRCWPVLPGKGVEMAFYQFPSVTAMFIALSAGLLHGQGQHQ